MQFNYRSKTLVVIDGDVYVYKPGKCKFGQRFISFQEKIFFLVNQKFAKRQNCLELVIVQISKLILF